MSPKSRKHFLKNNTFDSSTENSSSSPNQEKRIIRDMIKEQGKVTNGAIEAMTKAIIDKLDKLLNPNYKNVSFSNSQNDATAPDKYPDPNHKNISFSDSQNDATAPDKIINPNHKNISISNYQNDANAPKDNARNNFIVQNDSEVESIIDEIDNTNTNNLKSQIQKQRMDKLKQDQRMILATSKNWSDEIEKAQQNPTTNQSEEHHLIPLSSTNNTSNPNNIIQILTNNISHLEARIKTLENYNTVQNNRIEALVSRLDNQIQPSTSTSNHQSHQNPTNGNRTIIKPTITDDITDDGFVLVGPKRKKYAPIIGISPGEGPNSDPQTVPPLDYAKVLISRNHPPPPKQLPDNIIMSPITDTEMEQDDIEQELDEDQRNQLRDQIELSSLITGFKPITNKMLDREEKLILEECNEKLKNDKPTVRKIVIKNAIARFMKENLKMSQKDRDSVQIEKIFPAKKPNSNIYYIQCNSQEDISLITSHVTNLSKINYEKESPQIIPHIPNILYKRYQYCQKMLFKLRLSQPQKLRTNIRLGRIDFLLRFKQKGDNTPWRDLPLLIIPTEAPRPEMNLLKDKHTQNTSVNEPSPNPISSSPQQQPPQQTDKSVTSQNSPSTFIQSCFPNTNTNSQNTSQSRLTESSGSMSEHLSSPSKKHNMSDTYENTIQNKKNRQVSPTTQDPLAISFTHQSPNQSSSA